jgi:acetylornithine deacetylase/succinyl-diaminopimelate desuccinylase-like protein
VSILSLSNVIKYLDENEAKHLEFLFDIIRQKSISATGEGVEECADKIVKMMNGFGIRAKKFQTEGLPVVYGEIMSNPEALTVLIYGHYDVQPPEPLGQWLSDPFEPTIRDGKIFARGSGDDKGQFMAHILAAAALKKDGWPDINVKFLLDGEEESSSVSLPKFIKDNSDMLKADVAISSDGPKHPSGRPVVFFGVRGLLYTQITLEGAIHDLHSGNNGNVAPTPAWDLVRLLNEIYPSNGNCQIPHFYDDVLETTEYEQELIKNMPFEKEGFLKTMNLEDTNMDNEQFWHKLMFEPTVNICGIGSGYQGKGSKTIIPNQAMVKMDFRLVPNQDPDKIYKNLVNFVKERCPKAKVEKFGVTIPTRTSAELNISKAVVEAVRMGSKQEPVVQPRLGGSTPDYLITKHLKLPSIWVPFANADENNHSPNENINVSDFYDGIKISATIMHKLAQQSKEKLLEDL